MQPETLSLAAARRIALGAQGLAKPRKPGPVGTRQLLALIHRLNLHQIDSVNVLARAHYMPAFSRLGPYPAEALDRLAWARPRRLFEYWAHEASLLPFDLQPLLRWRMARAERGEGTWRSIAHFARERRDEVADMLNRIAQEGPLAASDFESGGKGGWWGWSDAKRCLEYLFWSGRLTTATRRASFERVYDLPERVLPTALLTVATPSEGDAHRALLERSARALGIATAADLRDYFRLSPADARPRIEELVEGGSLIPVHVRGWRDIAYLHRDARQPRRAEGQALLSPFDPLVWQRGRTERLFGMRYRIEIYTPAAKRVHGYYVLPFLLGDRLAARVDLKADRKAATLRVEAAHLEAGAPPETAERLAGELRLMADWLGLETILVARRGDLAPALAACVAARGSMTLQAPQIAAMHALSRRSPMLTTRERTTAIGGISPFFIVGDVGRSLAFYARIGFEPRFREPADDPFFAIVGRGEAQIFLKHIDGAQAQPNVGRHPWVPWDAFVFTPDPDALAEELDHGGVVLHKPPGDREDGLRGLELCDPDGYILFFGRPR